MERARPPAPRQPACRERQPARVPGRRRRRACPVGDSRHRSPACVPDDPYSSPIWMLRSMGWIRGGAGAVRLHAQGQTSPSAHRSPAPAICRTSRTQGTYSGSRCQSTEHCSTDTGAAAGRAIRWLEQFDALRRGDRPRTAGAAPWRAARQIRSKAGLWTIRSARRNRLPGAPGQERQAPPGSRGKAPWATDGYPSRRRKRGCCARA